MKKRLLALILLLLAAITTHLGAVTIVPDFTDLYAGSYYGVAEDTNAAMIPSYEAAINAAIAVVEADVTTDVTLNVIFDSMNSPGNSDIANKSLTGMAYSSINGNFNALNTDGQTNVSTSQWLTYLQSVPSNAAVNAEIASVKAHSNTVTSVAVSPFLMQVMGINTNLSVVTLATISPSFMVNASRTTNVIQNFYDMQTTVEHQLLALLGGAELGSTLGLGISSNTYGALDFLRYASNGVNYFSTSAPTTSSYFSINGGKTAVAYFSTNLTPSWSFGLYTNGYLNGIGTNNSYGDWAIGGGITGNGTNVNVGAYLPTQVVYGGAADLTAADLLSLQALGYQVVLPVPEPSAYALFGIGGFLIFVATRKRQVN